MSEFCFKCDDAGVLEVHQPGFSTLALCLCKQGKKQGWNLPSIPVAGFSEQKLNWNDFKPTKEMPYEAKIAWWRESVNIAENYWASLSQKPEASA